MNATIYQDLRAYAGQCGAVIGGLWISSFACFIGGLTYPGLSLICMLLGISSIFATGSLVRRFRRTTADIRFGMAWWMSILMFIYASLLMAVAQYIYFRYMDNGFLADYYASIMQQPEFATLMQYAQGGQDYQDVMEQVINMLRTISPIELTFQFMIYNFFLGIFLSIPAALIGCIGKVPTITNEQKQ